MKQVKFAAAVCFYLSVIFPVFSYDTLFHVDSAFINITAGDSAEFKSGGGAGLVTGSYEYRRVKNLLAKADGEKDTTLMLSSFLPGVSSYEPDRFFIFYAAGGGDQFGANRVFISNDSVFVKPNYYGGLSPELFGVTKFEHLGIYSSRDETQSGQGFGQIIFEADGELRVFREYNTDDELRLMQGWTLSKTNFPADHYYNTTYPRNSFVVNPAGDTLLFASKGFDYHILLGTKVYYDTGLGRLDATPSVDSITIDSENYMGGPTYLNPVIAMDSSGGFIAAWHESGAARPAQAHMIAANFYAPDGTPYLAEPEAITPLAYNYGNEYQDDFSLIHLGDDKYVCVFSMGGIAGMDGIHAAVLRTDPAGPSLDVHDILLHNSQGGTAPFARVRDSMLYIGWAGPKRGGGGNTMIHMREFKIDLSASLSGTVDTSGSKLVLLSDSTVSYDFDHAQVEDRGRLSFDISTEKSIVALWSPSDDGTDATYMSAFTHHWVYASAETLYTDTVEVPGSSAGDSIKIASADLYYTGGGSASLLFSAGETGGAFSSFSPVNPGDSFGSASSSISWAAAITLNATAAKDESPNADSVALSYNIKPHSFNIDSVSALSGGVRRNIWSSSAEASADAFSTEFFARSETLAVYISAADKDSSFRNDSDEGLFYTASSDPVLSENPVWAPDSNSVSYEIKSAYALRKDSSFMLSASLKDSLGQAVWYMDTIEIAASSINSVPFNLVTVSKYSLSDTSAPFDIIEVNSGDSLGLNDSQYAVVDVAVIDSNDVEDSLGSTAGLSGSWSSFTGSFTDTVYFSDLPLSPAVPAEYSIVTKDPDEDSAQVSFFVRANTPPALTGVSNYLDGVKYDSAGATSSVCSLYVYPSRENSLYFYASDPENDALTYVALDGDDTLTAGEDSAVFVVDYTLDTINLKVYDSYGTSDSIIVLCRYPAADTSSANYSEALGALRDTIRLFRGGPMASETVSFSIVSSGTSPLQIISAATSSDLSEFMELNIASGSNEYDSEGRTDVFHGSTITVQSGESALFSLIFTDTSRTDSLVSDSLFILTNDSLNKRISVPLNAWFEDFPYLNYDSIAPHAPSFILHPDSSLKFIFSENVISDSVNSSNIMIYSLPDSAESGSSLPIPGTFREIDKRRYSFLPIYTSASSGFRIMPPSGSFIPTDSLRIVVKGAIPEEFSKNKFLDIKHSGDSSVISPLSDTSFKVIIASDPFRISEDGISPPPGGKDVDNGGSLEISLNKPIDTASFSENMIILRSGFKGGADLDFEYSLKSANTRIVITPSERFLGGDEITAGLSGRILESSGKRTLDGNLDGLGTCLYNASFEGDDTLWSFVTAKEKFFAYPNPYAPGSNSAHRGKGITFRNFHSLVDRETELTIVIYNLSGDMVMEKTLTAGGSGNHRGWVWDTCNKTGGQLASGLYLYYVTGPDGTQLSGQGAKGKIEIVR